MSPAPPANTNINKVISGDSRIDALLLDLSDRLNSSVAPGTPAAGGMIRFSDTTQSGSAGYAYLANSSRTSLDSDVLISNSYRTNVTSGSYAWTTLVHALGHALGLKHPSNYNAMTYRDSAQRINDTWFMPYDLLALRYLYGTRAFEPGNNTYTYTDATGRSVSNIVDDGGTDTTPMQPSSPDPGRATPLQKRSLAKPSSWLALYLAEQPFLIPVMPVQPCDFWTLA